jgi:hypothetical protein
MSSDAMSENKLIAELRKLREHRLQALRDAAAKLSIEDLDGAADAIYEARLALRSAERLISEAEWSFRAVGEDDINIALDNRDRAKDYR